MNIPCDTQDNTPPRKIFKASHFQRQPRSKKCEFCHHPSEFAVRLVMGSNRRKGFILVKRKENGHRGSRSNTSCLMRTSAPAEQRRTSTRHDTARCRLVHLDCCRSTAAVISRQRGGGRTEYAERRVYATFSRKLFQSHRFCCVYPPCFGGNRV